VGGLEGKEAQTQKTLIMIEKKEVQTKNNVETARKNKIETKVTLKRGKKGGFHRNSDSWAPQSWRAEKTTRKKERYKEIDGKGRRSWTRRN